MELVIVQNFIGGQFVAPLDRGYIENINPSTGKSYGKVPNSTKRDVEVAVENSLLAFKTWSKTTKEERSRLLYRIADLIEARLEEFAIAESRDQGKPVSLSRTVDIPRVCANFRFFAGAILHHQEACTEIDGIAVNYTVRKPIGVCGLISPWNLPLYLLTWKIAPALAVGNTVVCKPSEFTSVTAWMLCSVLNEAGIPPGVCNMVFGCGVEAGKELVAHPKVPLISFTGGTATGQQIMRDSALHCKKLYLELGGKNPNIIFEDANLEECVSTTVRSSFSNQGEICLCGSRIFVQETIYERFMERFIEESRKLIVGNPFDARTTMGPLVSEEHRRKVESYISLAKQEGGTIVLGGGRPTFSESVTSDIQNGYFLEPTIITDLPATCRTQQEEIFGPVVGVTRFKTEEEVIEMANDCKYGLAAILWTENARRIHRVAPAIESGTVWVNCWMLRDLRVPFGGMKLSGLGRASGEHSIDLYTEQKTICIKYN